MADNSSEDSGADEQISAVLHWFVHWTSTNRDIFLDNLLCKAVPNKLFTIVEAMSSLGVNNQLQSMFHCQLRLFDNWFRGWTENQQNYFLQQLEHIDYPFVERLNKKVAETSGQF